MFFYHSAEQRNNCFFSRSTVDGLRIQRRRPLFTASRLWIKYPPLDAAVVDPENPRSFLRSAEWKKVRDDFFRGKLDTSAAWL